MCKETTNKAIGHIMLDLETLGTGDHATIFQIGAVAFDIHTGEVQETFNERLDIEAGDFLNIEGSTLKWWLNEDAELLKKLVCSEGGHDEHTLISLFNDWVLKLKENYSFITLWGNGSTFDNRLLKQLYERQCITYPFAYNADRDVRTLLDVASFFSGKSKKELKSAVTLDTDVKHDALADALYQARLVHYCYSVMADK